MKAWLLERCDVAMLYVLIVCSHYFRWRTGKPWFLATVSAKVKDVPRKDMN